MEDKNNTFWGLILQPGKRYEQIVEKSFHVSMAALDISSGNDKATVQVMINVDGQEFILCHLSKNRSTQQTLDLNFQGGDSLALYVDGQSPQPVHLTGFYNEMDDDDDMEGLEMSDESDEEEAPELIPAKLAALKKAMAKAGKGDGEVAVKRKGSPVKESSQKKTKLQTAAQLEEDSDDDEDDEEEGEEEEDDEDEEGEDEEVEEGFSDEAEDDDEDDEDEEDEEDDDDDDEEEVDEPPIPLKKGKSPAGKKEATPKANGEVKTGETPKKKKGAAAEPAQKTPVQQEKKAAQTPKSPKRTIGGGVMVEDIIVGSGAVAKRGRPVSVYYVGKLKQNNKQFDQTTGGPGFKFRLGGKEVIKGWDVGVEGMKVGGKRRITCPPHMAYGARGSPPVIPPNSALVFDITLKNVH